MGLRSTTNIVNLAAALGALVAPAAAPEIANATDSDEAHGATNSDEVQLAKATEAKAPTKLPRGEDLMRFTVHTSSDGTVARQASHDSHVSHSSHVSHASSS
jgi:hypothetical protein